MALENSRQNTEAQQSTIARSYGQENAQKGIGWPRLTFLGDTVPDRHDGTIPSNRARRVLNYSGVTSSMTNTTYFKNQHVSLTNWFLGKGLILRKN